MKAKPTKQPGTVMLEVDRNDEPLLAAASERTTPLRMKHILVPIDFSDCSKKALRYAVPLAKQHEADLTLLYVLPAPAYAAGDYGGLPTGGLEDEMRASSRRELAALAVDEVERQVPTDVVIRSGSAANEIMNLARSLPADLIVISTHGRTGLPHVFLGSVVERVVQRAPCPVLVVREEEREIV